MLSRRWKWHVCLWTTARLHSAGINRLPASITHRLFKLPITVRILFRRRHLPDPPSGRNLRWWHLRRIRRWLELRRALRPSRLGTGAGFSAGPRYMLGPPLIPPPLIPPAVGPPPAFRQGPGGT